MVLICWLTSVVLLPISVKAQCQKPGELNAVEIAETNVTLEWTGIDSTGDYEVEIRSKGRTPKLKRTNQTTESSLAVTGLEPGSDYKFRVRSHCSLTSSSGSTNWFSFQTAGMSPAESCPKAGNLQVSSSTSSTATLSWSPTEYATHFEVEVRSKGSTPVYFFERSTIDTSITVFGLSMMGKYQFRVRTTCQNTAVSGSTSWKMFVPGEDVEFDTCEIVSDLVIDSITSHSGLVHWSSTDGDAVFMLSISDGAEYDTVLAPATNPSLIEGLIPGTEYFVDLVANCTMGLPKTLSTSFVTLTEEIDSCHTPMGLLAESTDSLACTLSWNHSSMSESYQLQVDDFDTLTAMVLDTVITDTSFLFVKLDSIHLYSFRIRSICTSDLFSEYSEWYPFPSVTDSLITSVCDLPNNFKVDSTVGNNAFLSWSGPNPASFQIEVKTADTLWSYVIDTDDSIVHAALYDLQPFTDHEARVKSLCEGREESDYTPWLGFTTQDEVFLCKSPTDLASLKIDDSTTRLSWMGVDTASYVVEVEMLDTGSQVLQISSQDTNVQVSGLIPDTDYRFRVRSVCSVGDTSAFSAWHKFDLVDTMMESCDPPVDLTMDTISSTSAMLSWAGPEDATFALYLKDLDTVAATSEFVTEEQFFYFDSLLPETEYEVFIESICQEELSGFSESIQFTTLALQSNADSCSTPVSVKLDSVDTVNAWLSWEGPDSLLYDVELKMADSTSSFMLMQTSSGPSVHLEDLPADESFTFRVRALCSEIDTSEWSEFFVFQTLGIIEPPQDSCRVPVGELVFVNDTSALLSWTQSSSGAFYLLEVENIGLTSHYNLITTTRDTGFLIEGLTPGGLYQWKVAGFCDDGTYSDCSPWMIFETEGESGNGCLPPSGLEVTSGEEGSTVLEWNEVARGIDYEVEIESKGSTPFLGQSSIVLVSELVVDGLAIPGTYQFKVNVQCADGSISEDSDWYEFMTSITSDSGMITSASPSVKMAFPNPAQTFMMVKVPEVFMDNEAVIELNDMMGRTVLHDRRPKVMKADLLQFNVGNLREGIYQLSVRSAQDHYQELIFVRR